jgi:iron complex outermembrane receptor protein
MKTRSFGGHQLIHFHRWSRKSYAVFNSLGKAIKISRLNVAFSILSLSIGPALAQDSFSTSYLDEGVDLDELEVTAQSEPLVFTQVGRVITTISKKEIDAAPVSDLAGLLSFVQGVDIRQRGGYGVQADVSIRGGSFDQVLILLNGLPISDPQTGHFNLNIPVELSDIRKIEILKGPAARVFGTNAFSGAINIITQAAEENSLAVQMDGGQNALYHYGGTTNISIKNWHSLLSYNQKGSDGYMVNTDFSSRNLFLQSSLTLRSIAIEAQAGILRKQFGANSFYSPKYPMQYEKNQSRFASLGFHFGKKIRVSILPFYRQHRDHWQLTRKKPNLYQNFHQTDVLGLRAKMFFFSLFGKSTIGFNFKNEQLLSSSMGNQLDHPQAISWATGQEFKKDYHRNHAALFFEQNKKLSTKWETSFGLLAQWYTKSNTLSEIYPGLDISYHYSHHLKIFASINKAMRLPTFTDLLYTGPSNMGNRDLKPEKSLTFELGTQYQGENYQIQGAVFYRKATEVIDWIWQDSIWQTQNITELHTVGVELSTHIYPDKTWGVRWWKSLMMDYTYLDLQKVDKEEILSKYALNNLRHQLNVKVNFQILSHFFMQIQGSYKDRIGSYQSYHFITNAYEEEKYQDYLMLDARVSYRIRSFEAYIQAKNLKDIEVVEYGIPQAGLWVMGGIKYKLDL